MGKYLKYFILGICLFVGRQAFCQAPVIDMTSIATNIENAAQAAESAGQTLGKLTEGFEQVENMRKKMDEWFGEGSVGGKILKYGDQALDLGYDLGYLQRMVRQANLQRKYIEDFEARWGNVINGGGFGMYGLSSWLNQVYLFQQQTEQIARELRELLMKWKVPMSDKMKAVMEAVERSERRTANLSQELEAMDTVLRGAQEGQAVAQLAGRSVSASGYANSAVVTQAGSLSGAKNTFWRVMMYLTAFIALMSLAWGGVMLFRNMYQGGDAVGMSDALYYLRVGVGTLVTSLLFHILQVYS